SGAGLHRFVWDLHWPRPPAISYGYSIAAVWGEGSPVLPRGPWALPGKYTVVLTANGHDYSAPLDVTEDPRVKVSPTDLKASFDLSQRIAATLAEARRFYGEKNSVLKQLDGIKDAHFRPLADRIRQKPAPGEPTFESVDGILTGIENDLEATDGAPMAAQQQAFDDARSKLIEAQR